MAAPSSTLIDLRKLLAERFPQARPAPRRALATNIPCLDDATGGGLPKSAITELTSPHPSAGSALLIHALLQNAWRERYFLALVDGRDSFDPSAFERPDKSPLRNLLWLRCTNTRDAVKAADLLLRDGNFPLVILDLVLNPSEQLRKTPQSTWYRLQRLVEPTATAFLVLTRRSMIASAQLKLVLENEWSLADLQRTDPLSRLSMRVTRVQGAREREEMAG